MTPRFVLGPFLLLPFVMLSALLGARSARADDGVIEDVGGAARLMQDQGHIRMASETVRGRVTPDTIEMDCVFVLENRGPADTVLVGFPDRSSGLGVIPCTASAAGWTGSR